MQPVRYLHHYPHNPRYTRGQLIDARRRGIIKLPSRRLADLKLYREFYADIPRSTLGDLRAKLWYQRISHRPYWYRQSWPK